METDERSKGGTRCDVCGTTDFQNKHNIYSLQDRELQARHFRCCLRVGCPPEPDGSQSCATALKQRGETV